VDVAAGGSQRQRDRSAQAQTATGVCPRLMPSRSVLRSRATYTPAQFRGLVYDPTVHAPICFTAPAVRTVLPYTS